MSLKTAVLFAALLALAGSQSTSVSSCVNNGGTLPINTFIEGCPSPPCFLPQMSDVVLNIVFQAPHTMRSMKTLAIAYLFGSAGIPYDLGSEAVTCNFLTNTYCPVLQNEVVQYTLRMHIESWFPAFTAVTIEFMIVDEEETPFVCIRVPIVITLPRSSLNVLEGKAATVAHENKL